MEAGSMKIKVQDPKCYLSFGDPKDEGSMIFSLFRDFNWFQQKMLKWCFGLTYTKNKE